MRWLIWTKGLILPIPKSNSFMTSLSHLNHWSLLWRNYVCRRDATLVKAERILELTMETLASLDTEVGNEVYDAFVNRVKNQRNSEIIHVMEYLSNPDFVKICKTDSFGAKVDAKKIKDKIITLIKRLYPESFSNYTESSGIQSLMQSLTKTLMITEVHLLMWIRLWNTNFQHLKWARRDLNPWKGLVLNPCDFSWVRKSIQCSWTFCNQIEVKFGWQKHWFLVNLKKSL